MRSLILCILVFSLSSCKTTKNKTQAKTNFNQESITLKIEHLTQDSTLNIRALEILKEKFISPVYLTSKGEFGVLLPREAIEYVDSLKSKSFYSHKVKLSRDSINLNFRALAVMENKGFGISIGNPALVYSLDADLEKNKIVYQENHPKAFYDAMEFWNNQEGIAIGDPTDNCMSIIITRNGGKSWTKLSCENLPKAIEGEAAFAASDTNISIVGDETWVATGGVASRILYSPDKGKTWQVFNTPIIQGKPTTGIYSLDFYDAKNGFAIGGDYTNPDNNTANKIKTKDGGKTWTVVADAQNPGYRSCVKYVPNSNAKKLVAVGFKGIDYSDDAGETWKHLNDESFYTIRFANDSLAFAGGKGRLSKLIFK